PLICGCQASVAIKMRMLCGLPQTSGLRRARLAPAHGIEPVDEAEPAGGVLGDCRAALDPIATVHVAHAVHVAQSGVMDVSAHHAVEAAPARLRDERLLELADEIDGGLDF